MKNIVFLLSLLISICMNLTTTVYADEVVEGEQTGVVSYDAVAENNSSSELDDPVEIDIDTGIILKEDKTVLYFHPTDENPRCIVSECGGISGITINIDNIPLFGADGWLYFDRDSKEHDISVTLLGETLYQNKIKFDGKFISIGIDTRDKGLTLPTQYIEGILMSVDFREGLYIEDKWYKCSEEFNLTEASTLIGKKVGIELQGNYVVSIKEINKTKPYTGGQKYNTTPEEKVRIAMREYDNAMSEYLESYSMAAKKDTELSKGENISQQLKEWNDSKGHVVIPDVIMPSEAEEAVYEGVEYYLKSLTNIGIDLGKINTKDSDYVIGTKVIKSIINSMDFDNIKFKSKNGWNVYINKRGLGGAANGVITVQKGFESYYAYISLNGNDTEKILEKYLNDLCEISQDVNKKTFFAFIDDLSKITGYAELDKKIAKNIFEKRASFLKLNGYGDSCYEIVLDIKKSFDTTKELYSKLENGDLLGLSEIYSQLGDDIYYDSSLKNEYVKNSLSNVNKAKNKLRSALYDYLVLGKVSEDEITEGLLYLYINCPVDFEIYENNILVGSYINGVINVPYPSKNVQIQVKNDRKIISIPSDKNIKIKYLPTSDGSMDLIMEEILDGYVKGRLNFYNVDLIEGQYYEQAISTGLAENVKYAPLVKLDGSITYADEYISSKDDGRVHVDVICSDGGIVVGNGEYVKGDSVSLIAKPEDGYTLEGWYIGDVCVDINPVYRFVANDVSVKAVFKKKRNIHPDYIIRKNDVEYEEVGIAIYENDNNKNLADIKIVAVGEEYGDRLLHVGYKAYINDEIADEKTDLTTIENGVGEYYLVGIDISLYDDVIFFDSLGGEIFTSYYAENYDESEILIVDEDTVLCSDVVCRDLVLKACLDTNGYDLVVCGNVREDNVEKLLKVTDGSKVRVIGNWKGSGARTLNSKGIDLVDGTLIIYGDCDVWKGVSVSNDSRLIVRGELDTPSWGELANSGLIRIYKDATIRNIKMTNDSAVIDVKGDLYFDGSFYPEQNPSEYKCNISAGVVYAYGNIYNFNGSDSSKVYLYKEGVKTISNSIFAELRDLSTDKLINIERNNFGVNSICSDLNVSSVGIVCLYGDNTLSEDVNITINAPMINAYGCVNLDDGAAYVNGDLYLYGTIYLGNGKLRVNGNFAIEENVNDHEALLIMQKLEGKLIVDKEFSVFVRNGNSETYDGERIYEYDGLSYSKNDKRAIPAINAGTIICNGGIDVDKYTSYKFSGTSKVELDGDTSISIKQNVLNYTAVHNDIVLSNSTSYLYLGTLTSDVKVIASGDIYLGDCDLNGHSMVFEKSATSYYNIKIIGNININGGLFESKGDFSVSVANGCELYLNHGSMNINRNMDLYCGSELKMMYANDLVDIGGDFGCYFVDYNSKENVDYDKKILNISAGTIQVAGEIDLDRYFIGEYGMYTNSSEKSHVYNDVIRLDKLVLTATGTEPQYVHTKGAIIDVIELTRKKQYYYFGMDNCWNRLIEIEDDIFADSYDDFVLDGFTYFDPKNNTIMFYYPYGNRDKIAPQVYVDCCYAGKWVTHERRIIETSYKYDKGLFLIYLEDSIDDVIKDFYGFDLHDCTVNDDINIKINIVYEEDYYYSLYIDADVDENGVLEYRTDEELGSERNTRTLISGLNYDFTYPSYGSIKEDISYRNCDYIEFGFPSDGSTVWPIVISLYDGASLKMLSESTIEKSDCEQEKTDDYERYKYFFCFDKTIDTGNPILVVVKNDNSNAYHMGYLTNNNNKIEHVHIWESRYVIDVTPTCETDGSKSIHCETCSEKKYITAINALGHLWNEGEMIKKPTYNEKGIKKFICLNDMRHTKYVEVPKLDIVGDIIDEDVDENTERDLKKEEMRIKGVSDVQYTGSAITFDIRVYKGNKLLREGIDYTVKYRNNKNACTDISDSNKENAPTIVITGKGNYKSEKVEERFVINPIDMSCNEDTIVSNDVVAAGSKIYKPIPSIVLNGKKLKANTDYMAIYDSAYKEGFKESGIYEIALVGKGNYVGTLISTFRIADSKVYTFMSKASVSGYEKSLAYDGNVKEQDLSKVVVKMGKNPLVYGVDYSVDYINNVEVGTAYMIIRAAGGSNKYVGEKVVPYKITGTAISKANVYYESKLVYTGEIIKPTVTLAFRSGKVLEEGRDYTLTYLKNINVGTASIIISGCGEYTGTIKKTFKILPVEMDKEQISVVTIGDAYKNSSGKYEIKVEVKNNGKLLLEGFDYTISYKNNSKATSKDEKKAPTVTVKGKGNYAKSISVAYDIFE